MMFVRLGNVKERHDVEDLVSKLQSAGVDIHLIHDKYEDGITLYDFPAVYQDRDAMIFLENLYRKHLSG